jgi:spermidine synthase
MDVEEAVHYGMAQHPKPRRVLVLSGGFSTVGEVLKYASVEHVDYVELDPLVLDVETRFMGGVNDSRVALHAIDGRVYVREEAASGGSYDVLLVSLPDPANAQVGRFYTIEFFRDARRLLGDSGVFSISVSSNQNYQSPESRRLNACVYRTLKAAFGSVLVVPGGRNYYLASDNNLTYDIAGRIEKLGVETYFVNKYYLEGMLTPDRIKYAVDSITGAETIVNADFKPVSYYYYLEYWSSYFRLDMRLIAAILLAALFIVLHRLRPLHLAVYTAGFSGAALEVILLLAFQALYGVAYRWVGLLASSFMLGLFLGGRHASRRNGDLKTVKILLSSICVYSIALPAVTYTLSILPPGASCPAAQLAFPLLAAILGFSVGCLFPTAASVVQRGGGSAGEAMGVLYFLDMSGAFFGSLISGILLVPLLGVAYSSLIVFILNLTSVIRLRRGGE